MNKPFDIEDGKILDAPFDTGNAGDFSNLSQQPTRNPFGGDENIRKTVALVVGCTGFIKRQVGPIGERKRGNTG